MKKQTIPLNIKRLAKMYDNGTLTCENEIQRCAGQWSNDQKSLLIHSILDDYIVPPIYLIKSNQGSKDSRGRDVSNYDVLDGKQRLTTVFAFLNGEFPLSDITPNVEVDGEEYDISGMYFADLPEDLQENIRNFSFLIYNLEGNADDEVEEFFLRINGGVALSKNQVTKGKVGIKTMRYLNTLLSKKFFKDVCSFSGAQARNEVDICTCLQSAMIFDVMAGKYELSTFSELDVQKYGATLHDGIDERLKAKLDRTVDYLSEAFTKKEKWLKKTHAPMVVYVASIAAENNITPKEFADWFEEFAYSYYTPDCEYAQFCGAGSIKKPKVMGRIETMKRHFMEYFNLTEETLVKEDENADIETADVEETENANVEPGEPGEPGEPAEPAEPAEPEEAEEAENMNEEVAEMEEAAETEEVTEMEEVEAVEVEEIQEKAEHENADEDLEEMRTEEQDENAEG